MRTSQLLLVLPSRPSLSSFLLVFLLIFLLSSFLLVFYPTKLGIENPFKFIGPDRDMLMGDLGVSDKELGYMFGRYKRLTGNYHSMMSRYSAANEYRQKADGMGAVLFAKVRHLYIGHSSNPMIFVFSKTTKQPHILRQQHLAYRPRHRTVH